MPQTKDFVKFLSLVVILYLGECTPAALFDRVTYKVGMQASSQRLFYSQGGHTHQGKWSVTVMRIKVYPS